MFVPKPAQDALAVDSYGPGEASPGLDLAVVGPGARGIETERCIHRVECRDVLERENHGVGLFDPQVGAFEEELVEAVQLSTAQAARVPPIPIAPDIRWYYG